MEETWEQWNWYIERFLTSTPSSLRLFVPLSRVINYSRPASPPFARLMGPNYRRANTLVIFECYVNHSTVRNVERTVVKSSKTKMAKKSLGEQLRQRLGMPRTKHRALLLRFPPSLRAFHFIRESMEVKIKKITNVDVLNWTMWNAQEGKSPRRASVPSRWFCCHTREASRRELSDCRVFIWIFYPQQQSGNLSLYP